MPYEINKVHHDDFLNNGLPDKCAKLIISDPPYFEVKGDFDFIWRDREHYLQDVELWAKECKRLLADNGTLFWYGHAKKIAYSQIILDKYFCLENSLVWHKTECNARKCDYEQTRCFTPVTERILMYSNFSQSENDWKNNNSAVYFEGFEPIRLWLKSEIAKIGMSKAAAHLGISDRAIGHWVSRAQWCMPNKENADKLKELGIFLEYEQIRTEYEQIRTEYAQTHRRHFDNAMKLTDVLLFSQEAHITKNYDHETKKPETLTRALILTCSKPNDLVIIPFAGSGTECAMAKKEKRQFIGYDIDKKNVDMSNNRCDAIPATLF
jgi:DNA modification methylase